MEWNPRYCGYVIGCMRFNNKTVTHHYHIYKHDDIPDLLEQRKSKFKNTFGEQKSLQQIFSEHEKFLRNYLEKCIFLHSTVQVRDLIENIDDLLDDNFKQTKIFDREILKEKLKSIKIPFICKDRLVKDIDETVSTYDSSQRRVNNNQSNFLPSLEQTPYVKYSNPQEIHISLRYYRWLVILGDPGSSKTTFLRWITCAFADAARDNATEIYFDGNEDDCIRVRIPILIRIGEFVEWLKQNPAKTLIDYIGIHTWFSESYCDYEDESVLKELIYHGHALILLDGLDEIPEVGQRKEVVDLVMQFIDEYVRNYDFFSPFDYKNLYMPSSVGCDAKLIPMSPPNKSDGNQIIITSRIIGYKLCPLTGPYIKHLSLLLMNYQEAREFVEIWISNVEKSLRDMFSNEVIHVNEKKIEDFLKRRSNSVKTMFENGSRSLTSNPSILSLICTSIYKSSDEFCPQSRIEVYDNAVQSILRSWTSKEPNISKDMLTNVLMDLATYIHLQSPSGLIDAVDMEHLCCFTLQKQGVSADRTKLREYTKTLMSLLDSNVGIACERGLQIFGFLHLSFQEYFVAQALVRDSSSEDVAKRILSFTINPRFRESLFLALGWISWKWSFDDYEKFCILLVTSTKDYVIPFGALLFFEAFDDLQRLPSNSVIHLALNRLLNHPSNVITRTYLPSNLLKLHKNIPCIMEWIQLHLKDETRRFKFCQYTLMKLDALYNIDKINSIRILRLICQELKLFSIINDPTEFIIDQIMRRLVTLNNSSDDMYNNEFSLYFSSLGICSSKIHPLILSVIIAVCGGLTFKIENNIRKFQFSPKELFYNSLILKPIQQYFANNKDPHSIKVQTLIKQFENSIEASLFCNTSPIIVDTFVALICLQSVSQPLIYKKYEKFQALPLALKRLKRTWFYLKKANESTSNVNNQTSLIKPQFNSIIQEFYLQSDQSGEQLIPFSLAWAAASCNLSILNKSEWFNLPIFHVKNVIRYLKCQPEFYHFYNQNRLDQMNENIHPLQMFQQEPFFLLTFVPESLQQLYYYTVIKPFDNMNSLPKVVLLSQILIHLNDFNAYDSNIYLALAMLQSLFKQYNLENYALVLFWKENIYTAFDEKQRKQVFEAVKDRISFDPIFIHQPNNWETFINIERQRISQAINATQNEEKNLRLFAASISLARLFQAEHYCCYDYETRSISLPHTKNEEVHFAISNIQDPVLKIIALSIVYDMTNPMIFDEQQRDELQRKMIDHLQLLLPHCPLLVSTLLLVRCYSIHQFFPVSFIHIVGEKLNESSKDKPNIVQETAYIAMRQLNNLDLSHYLSKFEKQTKNLSDLLNFNSTIFFRYYTNTTSFSSSNVALLSIIYLAELAFDAQILNMYNNASLSIEISPSERLNQLWEYSSKCQKIMTFKIATFISNYLQMSNEEEIHQIIKGISDCSSIERKALSVVEEWLKYRVDKRLRLFAYYAALELTIAGKNVPNLMDIINELFEFDRVDPFPYLFIRLLNSEFVELTTVREIIPALNQNIHYSSSNKILIDRKEIFELILQLELDRITANAHSSSVTSPRPFVLLIIINSENLQLYLVEHLCIFINTQNEIEDTIKEKYLAIIIKWIIESRTRKCNRTNFLQELYDFIFTLLHNHRFPEVRKAIVSALNSFFVGNIPCEEHVFMENTICHLEKVIRSANKYPEDVLAICLLTYGNGLLNLQRSKISRNMSNEIQVALNTLSETSTSEIICIRSVFCLIIAQQTNISSKIISNKFKEKWNITPRKRYNILLQQTLYSGNHSSPIFANADTIIAHIKTHFDELMEIFINEFYNYLCNKDNSNYLSVPEPDYVHIAFKLSHTKFDKFRDTMQKCSFTEEQFKTELYLYHKRKQTDCTEIIYLYVAFRVMTIELLDMLKWIEENEHQTNGWDYLENIEQVSNQEIIDKIFERLNLVAYTINSTRFSSVVKLLIQLAENHVVSSLEVHQKILPIIEKRSFENENKEWNDEMFIFNFLLDLSCIQNEVKKEVGEINKSDLFTEKNIEEEFEKNDRNSILLLRRNFFLSSLRLGSCSFD